MDELKYLTDSYDEKIKRINEIGAPLNFIFITDQHNRLNALGARQDGRPYELAANAINSMRFILERCPGIRFVVSGGDIGCDYDPNPENIRASYRETMDALYSLPIPIYCCVGNHDDAIGNEAANGWNTREAVILPDELHRLCMKYNPTSENYYYIDSDEGGERWRFVFLNTSDLAYFEKDGGYTTGYDTGFSKNQIRWLENDALKTDREIVVFSHIPLHYEGILGVQGLPIGIKPFDEMYGGPRVYYMVKQCPNVKMLIAGHVHYDNLVYDDRLLSVTTLCSLVQEWMPSGPRRIIGTPSETAFDVFSIKENKVTITRFGAGQDRCGILLRRIEKPLKYYI